MNAHRQRTVLNRLSGSPFALLKGLRATRGTLSPGLRSSPNPFIKKNFLENPNAQLFGGERCSPGPFTPAALNRRGKQPLFGSRNRVFSPEKKQSPPATRLKNLKGRGKAQVLRRKSMSSIPVHCNYVVKCAYKSRIGSMNGKSKKLNQDAFVISPYLGGVKSQYVFGVFDGHGSYGHEASNFIKSSVTKNIEDQLCAVPGPDELLSAVKKGLLKTTHMLEASPLDTNFSGSTVSLVFIRDELLFCANVGDSRTVLAREFEGNWETLALSQDHKPADAKEKERILKANGRVQPYYNAAGEPLGPDRVWLEKEQIPGLAMSRSLGDRVAHLAGVISDPDITSYQLSKDDRFIIVASDGLWEFISNEEAVSIVREAMRDEATETCCQELVKEAVKRWKEEENSVDDITVIVIFLGVAN